MFRYCVPVLTILFAWAVTPTLLPTWGPNLLAQEPQPTNVAQQQETEAASREFENFGDLVGEASSLLQRVQDYRVDIQCQFSGQDSGSLPPIYMTMLSSKDRLKLEVRDKPNDQPQFVVAYQNETLLRYSAVSNNYSMVKTDNPRAELQSCMLTSYLLEMGGVSFLLSPQARESIMSQVTHVHQLVDEDNRPHFSLTFVDGRHVDVWFGNQPGPLPVQLRLQTSITVSEQVTTESIRNTRLKWSLNNQLTDKDFSFDVPDAAVRVDDLAATMAGRGIEDLIGKALPTLTLRTLTDEAVDLQTNQQPCLLYFWATWAAPSVEQIPGILQFAGELKAKGVRVVAIDVADETERVKAFVEANGYDGEILVDRDGNAAHALRLTHLPVVVLVGPDNSVQAIFQKANAEIRPEILRTLEKMIQK